MALWDGRFVAHQPKNAAVHESLFVDLLMWREDIKALSSARMSIRSAF